MCNSCFYCGGEIVDCLCLACGEAEVLPPAPTPAPAHTPCPHCAGSGTPLDPSQEGSCEACQGYGVNPRY